MSKDLKLAIAIPCYNEELLIESTTKKILEVLSELQKKEKISQDSFIYYVDDGSVDSTWLEIAKVVAKNPSKVKAARFSTNFGNQKALLASMINSYKLGCDAVITIDADLQQDVNKIEEFVDKYLEGYKIVFGIRNDRKTDDIIKKLTALAFYKTMNILGVKIPKNHSDFRLVSKEVLEVLDKFKETDLFLRSFFHKVGFSKTSVYFDVKPRKIGKSKFNLVSLTALAINGITSFSVVPLKLICVLGFICAFFGFLAGIWAIIAKFVWNDSPNGWAEAIILTSFFGGIQIFCIGIVGEYIGQIFREVKRRPRYIIEQEL